MRNSNRQPSTGFTLLEILIAIFIFAVIITIIFGSYRTVFSNTEVINQRQAYYEMAQGCLNRMAIDLQSIHVVLPPAYTLPDFDAPPDPYRIVGDVVYIQGMDFPRLRFTSLTHLPFNQNQHDGIAEIVYYVQETDDNTFVLKRSDSLYPSQAFEAKARDPILCEGLKSLEYTFYNQQGNEYETWNSDLKDFEYATPKSIKIKLELGNSSNTLLFETRVILPVSRKQKE